MVTLAMLVWGIRRDTDLVRQNIKRLAEKQVQQLDILKSNCDRLTRMWEADSRRVSSESANAMVLGASIANKNGDRILGLEDTPEVIELRDMISLLENGRMIIADITDTDGDVAGRMKGIWAGFLPKSTPAGKTDVFAQNLDTIYEYFRKSTDRDRRWTTLGVNLKVAFQMAIDTQNDVTINRLQAVIGDFQSLIDEEKDASTAAIPAALGKYNAQVLANDETMYQGLASLPDSVRKKEVQTATDHLKNMLAAAARVGAVNRVNKLDFWVNDPTVNSIASLKKEWLDWGGRI